MRTTVILFALSYFLRILLTLHYVFDVIRLTDIGEFWGVQIEVIMTFFCDLPPLYYFVYQHITNLTADMQVEVLAVTKDQGVAANQNKGMVPLESPASSHSNAETVILLERPQQLLS